MTELIEMLTQRIDVLEGRVRDMASEHPRLLDTGLPAVFNWLDPEDDDEEGTARLQRLWLVEGLGITLSDYDVGTYHGIAISSCLTLTSDDYSIDVTGDAAGYDLSISITSTDESVTVTPPGLGTEGTWDLSVDVSAAGGIPITVVNNPGDLIIGDGDDSVTVLPIGDPGGILYVENVLGVPTIVWADAYSMFVSTGCIEAQGDLIVGDANGAPAQFPAGDIGEVLVTISNGLAGTDLDWQGGTPSINDLLLVTDDDPFTLVYTSVSDVLDAALGNSEGDIAYRTSTGWEVRAIGDEGDVFTVDGLMPIWTPGFPADPASGAVLGWDDNENLRHWIARSAVDHGAFLGMNHGSTAPFWWQPVGHPAVVTVDGEGDPQGVTGVAGLFSYSVANGFAFNEGTVGDLWYHNGTTWTKLSTATHAAGDVLTLIDSGGGVLLPAWVTP